MERRKLTKEDIDKVRDIEGFPLGKDEDIIALSDAPYYTACPNPFIADFIKEHGTPYDEATDDYHREPFAADVSEGKNDPLYNAHSYHTKVPYKAIMRYILHYTEPGDVIFDGFCGTGMAGVAAQMCGSNDLDIRSHFIDDAKTNKWGVRKAVINDLSPIATFISHNYNAKVDTNKIKNEADNILQKFNTQYGWMYKTHHIQNGDNQQLLGTNFSSQEGIINYTVWSDVFICPNCGEELIYWDIAVDATKGLMKDMFHCIKCGAELKKKDCEHAIQAKYDKVQNCMVSTIKQKPVLINYTFGGKRYNKKPDKNDLNLIEKIENMDVPGWLPADTWPEGEKTGEPIRLGYKHVYQIYTKRNQVALSFIYDEIKKCGNSFLLSIITSVGNRNITRCNRFMINKYNPNGRINGPMPGNLYISSLVVEQNAYDLLSYKLDDIIAMHISEFHNENVLITNQSSNALNQILDNSIDYIFTDPPFGYNINYSELNYINESWLKIKTNNKSEAIMSPTQSKGLLEYQNLMQQCFTEFFRVIKPNRWITVEFHNSQNAVWNSIQEALLRSGFIVADVRTLDKRQGSINQDNAKGAVQQDLVISAYKPKGSFRQKFFAKAGSSDTAWEFVKQHLENIPVVVLKEGRIEISTERQAFLLFDRMVAYHIMNGIPVPLDATDFYCGLDEKFLKRDGMYFLANQVNEYDTARIKNDVEPIQFQLFVTNEKSARAWLYQQLDTPQTYAEIQPKFMQEIKIIDKFEDMPELSILLEENFLQNDEGKWYIPDVTKEADVLKLREKKLLKEFEGYLATKGKLKLFRSEAVRVGFAKLWADKNYKLIVETAERLPEDIIQEDDKLLMYYDISLGRV